MAGTVDVKTILRAGLQSEYDTIESHDSDLLYFCTDTHNMYKGDDLYTDGIREITTDPANPAVGVIYYNSTDDVLKYYNGTDWTTIRLATVTSVSSESTDEQVPTAAAVYNMVTTAIDNALSSIDTQVQSALEIVEF